MIKEKVLFKFTIVFFFLAAFCKKCLDCIMLFYKMHDWQGFPWQQFHPEQNPLS